MFPLLWIGLLFCAFGVYAGGMQHAPLPALVAGALACAAGIAAVFWQWHRHPHGVFDWTQGGVVDVIRADAQMLTWVDWAIFITRRGAIHREGGWVRLERRLLFGLVPLGSVVRPLTDFYRVEVSVTEHRNRRRRRGLSLFDDDDRVSGYTHSVSLVDRRGDRLCVLDLTTGVDDGGGHFIGRVRGLLEEIVGVPGLGARGMPFAVRPPAADPSPPAPPAPAKVDDFEAWRARRDGRSDS
ncbi:MAG: hypothetical protein M9894_38845 [Planctomycetes bacterium]|nr:hypothetical protein [Planctomycetota bacterium]